MNPNNHNNFYYAPEIINPNYRSNIDSRMSEGGTESTGTSNENIYGTNYSTNSSNFGTVGPVTYVA